MKDEIKEILKDLEFASGIFDYTITPDRCTFLKDYITNLQKEENKLIAESTEWESKYYDMLDNFHNANEEINKQKEEIYTLDKENKYIDILLEKYKNVIDKIKEYIHHEYFKREQLGIVDKTFYASDMKCILELLEEIE